MANAHKDMSSVGRGGGCPYFWTPQDTVEGPAYLASYQERFYCDFGKHASLLTSGELEICLCGRREDCPARRCL